MDCSSGVNPLGPSNKVKAALRKAIKKINNSSYMEINRLKRFFESKFRLSSENMIFANSFKQLIYMIPEVLNPKRVLIVGPSSEIYEDAALLIGSEVSYLNASEANGFLFNMSWTMNNLKNTDLVFLSNPSRVTGKMVPSEKIYEIINLMSNGGPHFVIDESLIEFAGVDDYNPDIINKGNCTILRTTAYFYGMSGLELAYAVSSPEVIKSYEKNKHWDINMLSVEAARTAFKDKAYIRASRKHMLFEKKALMRIFNKIEWITAYDTDTNIILIKINKNHELVMQELKRAGLFVRDCAEIRGLDKSFFRISVMKHENNLKLISVMKKVYQPE